MNITARRISGSAFSAEDKLEVTLNSDNQALSIVTHTIEVVSGGVVTHGGGAPSGEHLNYVDIGADGITDYPPIEMAIVQATQGTSVIKVVCDCITKADQDSILAIREAYVDRVSAAGVDSENPNGTDGTFTEEPPKDMPTIITLKTGEITVEWSEDTPV